MTVSVFGLVAIYLLILFILLFKSKKVDSSSVYWLKIIVGIGVVIGACIYLFIYILEQANLKEDEEKIAVSGTIKGGEKISMGGYFVTVSLGNILNIYSMDSLENGMLVNLDLKGAYDQTPFTIKFKNSTLYISVTLRDMDGNIVAEIKDNEWEINKNNYFKRNFDSNGFEVIDKSGILKLQIFIREKDLIFIHGVLKDKSGYIIIAQRDWGGTRHVEMSREEIIKQSEAIPNMFKYPSEKYLGVRAPITPLKPRDKDAPPPKIQPMQ